MCEINRELLNLVLLNLSELSKIASAEFEARKHGNLKLATELDQRLDEIFEKKTRSVGTWQDHVREHGCFEFKRHA